VPASLRRAMVALLCALCGVTIGLTIIVAAQHRQLGWAHQRMLEELFLLFVVYVCASAPYSRRRLASRIRPGTRPSPFVALAAFAVGPMVAPSEVWRDIRSVVERR
jgi:uncharacterized membrane protein YfcA